MDRIPPSSSNAAPASLSVAALATSNTSIVSSAAASAGSSPSAHARSFSHSLGAAGKRAAAAPAPTGATATACGADGRADSCGAGPSPPIVSHQQLQLQQQHAFHAFQQVGAAHSTELLRSPKSPSRSSQRGGDRERDGGRRSQQSQQQQLQQQYAYAHSDTALSYERQLTAASDSGGWDANSASCGLEVVGRGIYRGGLGIGGPPDGEGLGMDFGFAEAEMPEAHDFLSSTDGTNNGQSYDYGHGGGRYGNMAFSTSLSSPAPQQHHDPAGAAEDASSDGPHSTSGNRHSQQQQQQQQQRGASASPALVATSTTSSLFGIHTAGSFVSLAREALQHVGGREGERRPTDRSYQMGGFDAVPPSAVLPAPAATLSSSAAAGLRQHSLSGQGFSSGSLFGFPTNPSPSSQQQQQQHQYPQQQGALLGFAALPFSASSNGLFQPNPRHYLTSSSAAHQHPYDNISNNSTTTATTAGGTLALGTAEDGYPYSASAAEARHRRLASLPFASVAAQHSAYVPAGAPLLGGSFYSHSASYGGGGGGGPASFLRHSYSKSNLSRQPSFRRMVRTAAQSHSHYRAAGRIGGGGGSHSYASAGAYPPQQYNSSSEHRRSHHGHSYHPFGTDALGGTNAPSPASVRASAGTPMHYLHGGGHAGAGSEGSASPFGHHSPLPVSASNKLDVVALSLRASMRLPGQSFAPASAVHSSGDVLSSVGDAAMGFSETPLHPLHGLGALRSSPHSAAAADAPSAVAAEERLASAVWETVKRRPAMMLSVFLDSFFAAMRPPAPSAQAPLPRSRGAASAAGAGSVGKESCANSYAAAASASVAADNNNSSVVLIGTPTVQDEPAALPSDATQYDEKGRAAAATVPPPPPPHPFTDAYDDVTAAPATFAAADTDAYVYEEEVSPAADGEGEGYDGYAAVGVDAYGEDTAAAAEGGGEAYGATLSQVYGACFTSSQRVLTEPAEPLVPFTHSDGVTRCVDNAEGNLVIYVGMVLLGWLEVVSELGSGSFGQVVLCRDLRTVANVASLYERQLDYKYYYTSPAYCDVEQSQGTLVAVKVIGNGETCEAQSYVEAQIMQDLLATQQGDGEGEGEEGAEGVDFDDDPRRHFICRILASGASYGHHCIAMERYSCNLYEYLVSNSMDGLPISVVRAMAHQCLASLALVHGKGYMHCDIKPENIMVKLDEQHCGAIPLTAPCDAVEGGEVDEGSLPPSASACGSSRPPPVEIAVIDFSSSCEIDNPSYYEYIQSRYYRAPEAIVAAPYSTPMDIWSLGCVLAEMLIGRPLLPGANNFHQLNRITEMFGPLPPSLLREGVNTAAYYHCPPQHHHAQQEQQQQQQGQGEDGQEGQQYYAEEGAEEGYSQQHMHHTTSSSNGDGFVAFSSLHASLSNGGGAIAPPHGSTDGAPNNSSGVTFKNSYGGNADDAVLGVSGEEGEDGEGANGEDGDAMAAVGGGTSPSHPCLQTLPPHTTMAQLLAMHEGGDGTTDDQSEGAGAHGGGGGDADVGEECGADAAAAHMSSHAEMSELCAGGYAAASAAAVVGCGGEAFAVSSTRPPLFLVGEAGRYDTMGQRCPAAAAALAANVSSSTPFACPNVPTAAGTPLVLEEAAVAAAEGSHAFGSSKRPSSVAAIGIGIFASDRAGSARNLSAMTGHGHSTATGTAAPTLSVVTGEGDGSADPSLSSASYAGASPPGGGYPHPPTLGPSPASPCGIGHGFGGQRHSLNPTADAAIAAAAAAAEGNTHARPSGMPRRSVDASKNSTEGFGGASLSASPSTPFCPPPLPSGAATVPPVRQCAGASLARPTPLSLQPTGPDGEAPTGVDVGFAGPGGFAITPSDEGPSPNSDDVLVSVPNSGGFQPALGGLPLPLAPAAMASPTSPNSGGGSAAFLQQRDQTCEFFEQPSSGMGGAMGFGLPPNSGASAAATPDRADGKGRRGPALKPLAVRCLLEDGEPSAAKDSGQGHGLGLGGEDCGYGGELLQTQDTTPVAAERRHGEGDGNNGGGWKVADGPRAATGATNGSTSDASSPNANSTGMGRSLHGLHQSHGSSQWSPTHHYYGGSSGAGAGGGSVGGGPYPHHSASLHSASISAASPPQFPPSASSPSAAAGVAEGYAMMSEAEFCALHGCEPAPWLRYLKYDTLHEIVQHMRLSEEEQLLSRRGLVRQRKALYQFLRSMLQVDPRRRPSAEELLAHPFITQRYVATGTASSASGAAGGGRVGGPPEGPIGGQ